MRSIKLLTLFLAAGSVLAGMAAGQTWALPEHIYKIEDKKLEPHETKEIIVYIHAGTELILHGEEEPFKGVTLKWVVDCRRVKAHAVEHPIIVGGVPGTFRKRDSRIGRMYGYDKQR